MIVTNFKIKEELRNNYLFMQLTKIATSIKDYSTLENKAFKINTFSFANSLDESEVTC